MRLPECFEHDTLPTATCNLQLGTGALPCDAWHHYYHYQSSAQYLWLAEALRALGRIDEAMKAYDRAIFQDHFNKDALDRRKISDIRIFINMPSYDKHSPFDLHFRCLIGDLPDEATVPHDAGALALQEGDIAKALKQFETAIAVSPMHSNSHFGLGKCHFLAGGHEQAIACFAEATRLSHIKHDAYHRSASAEHLARGREFINLGNLDLAVNDFTKALDLYRGNREALKARARAYRAKGNIQLAEADEQKAKE